MRRLVFAASPNSWPSAPLRFLLLSPEMPCSITSLWDLDDDDDMFACNSANFAKSCSFCSGLSSWTVWQCCRRLSSLEKDLRQWHWKGRSPVCFRIWRARCSLLVKTMRQSPNPWHWNMAEPFVPTLLEREPTVICEPEPFVLPMVAWTTVRVQVLFPSNNQEQWSLKDSPPCLPCSCAWPQKVN